MNPFFRAILTVLAPAASLAFVAPASPSHAQPPPIVPANCVEHTSFEGGPDYPGDYRCAGLAIDYHVNGVASSPYPIWAGQWLFVDDDGSFRLGLCTFNRGIHPTIDGASTPITQSFPNDPSGGKRAYLTWKYGDTTDPLTAAALWAVFHYYAQDAAGSNRAWNPGAPLVRTLTGVSEASGRQDIEDLAVALDTESVGLAGPFAIDLTLDPDGHGSVHVRSGSTPVAGVPVTLTAEGAAFDGDSSAVTVIVDADGSAAFDVSGPAHAVTVRASVPAPAPAQVYRGAPAEPAGHLPQTLITRAPDATVEAVATATLTGPTATTTTQPATTTTTTPVTTTIPVTTTTAPATTTTTVPVATTMEITTTTPPNPLATPTPTTMTVPVTPLPTAAPPTTPAVVTLPRTGPTGTADMAASLGIATLVAGIGVIGAVRRRHHGDAADDAVDDTVGDGWFDAFR